MQISDTADNERWKHAPAGYIQVIGDDVFLKSGSKADPYA